MMRYLVINENHKISMYNLMVGVGLIAGFLILDYTIRKKDFTAKYVGKVYLCVVITLLAGFIGSLIFSSLTTGKSIFSFSGLTFYGGLFFGGVSLITVLIITKINIIFVMNLLTPSLIIGHAFGRIGCFFAGCCHGIPTNSFLGISFPEKSIPYLKYGSMSVHPTQLYEALFLFVLFFVVVKFVPFRFKTCFYFLIYGFIRFILEFFRGDERGVLFGIKILSPSQIISIMLISMGSIILFFELKKKNCLNVN